MKKQKEETLLPQAKLLKLFQLIAILKAGRWTIPQLAQRFDSSQASMYRYIQLLESVEFCVEKDFHNRYFIVTSDDNPSEAQFDMEELKFIKTMVHAAPRAALKDSLMKKLSLHSEFDSIPRLFLKTHLSMFVEQLAAAMHNLHQVVLVNYHSASSNDISDRHVEPIHFGDNYQSVMALDTKDKTCKQFKLDRIGDIIEKRVRFKFEEHHKQNAIDIFGFTGKIEASVKLTMSLRAWLLLREEHPLAIPFTTQLENGYEFKGPVSNYAGIARFVLGLLNEITIIEPKEFKDYITKRMKEQKLVVE